MTTEEKMIAALRAWRKAADKGYGERDHSRAHMEIVDSRIRKLKAKYEALADKLKQERKQSGNPRGATAMPRNKWVKGKVRVTKSGKVEFKRA